MHSQATDFKTVDCALEVGLGLLLGAGSHVRRGGGALSLHSLLPAAGFLADKGAIPLPPPGAPQQPNQQSSQASPPPLPSPPSPPVFPGRLQDGYII